MSEPSLPSEPITAGAKLGNYFTAMCYTNDMEQEMCYKTNVWVPLVPTSPPLNFMLFCYTAIALISGNILKP